MRTEEEIERAIRVSRQSVDSSIDCLQGFIPVTLLRRQLWEAMQGLTEEVLSWAKGEDNAFAQTLKNAEQEIDDAGKTETLPD